VTGRVRDAAGAPVPRALVWARWEGGEGRWFGKEDGSFRFSVLARDLTVVAERRDGLLGARSDEVAVAGNDGGEWTLDLVVPIERKAGLGIGIGPVPGGMGVRMVHPGTPADRAGLEVGDVIVSVDGVDADGMTAEDFVGRMTGPEGSFVRFAVRSPEGVEEELRLRREFLEPTGPR
jgi:S1-C subfamily serine protease